MFKTTGADISIIFQNDFQTPEKMEITSAFFAPFNNQKLTKMINFETGIFSYSINEIYDTIFNL